MIGQVRGLGGSTSIPPLGYIWKSASSICPAELYDGTTWAQIKDQAVLASGDSYTLGDVGGSTTATLTTANLPEHIHSGTTSSAGTHTHRTDAGVTSTGRGGQGGYDYNFYGGDKTTSSAGAHTHTVTVGSTGGDKAFSILMPYIVRYMWERIG